MADNIKVSEIKKENGVDYVHIGPNKGDNSEFFYSKFTELALQKCLHNIGHQNLC